MDHDDLANAAALANVAMRVYLGLRQQSGRLEDRPQTTEAMFPDSPANANSHSCQ